MEDVTRYELLILKELEHSLSTSEEQELRSWLKDGKNKIFYEEQRKLWGRIDDLQKMKKINRKKALKKVESQIFGRPIIRYIRNLERVAALLFIPLLLSALWIFFNPLSIKNTQEKLVYNTVEIPEGVRSSMQLPDGTEVWLNSGSKLKYPVTFDDKERKVELIGEAFFEVKKDESCPFVVRTSDVDIEVLGTSFNCSAYLDGDKIETALLEGKVKLLSQGTNQSILMAPGELSTFSKKDRNIQKKKVNLDKYFAWKTGKLMFRDDPMDQVILKLGRWYGVEFQVENQEILDYEYSATFSNESLELVLKMLSLSAPIDFRFLPRNRMDENTFEQQVIQLYKK